MSTQNPAKNPTHAPVWHSLPAQDALAALEASHDGLSSAEAAKRLQQYGPNRLTPPPRRGPLMRFLLQFHNVLIYVLLAAAFVTALLAHWVDTSVIVGVVAINAVIGFIQEGKAEQAMEAIRRMLSPEATVLRGGKRVVVAAETLVPGDIVLLQSGDKVPADLRLLNTKNLCIEEASLTGESAAIEKEVAATDVHAVLGDRYCMAYSSTLVVYGQGVGVVVATADATEIGRISTMLEEVKTMTTPLLRQMEAFSRWLTFAIMALAAVTFLFGWLVHHFDLGDMFLAAVSMAVAAIPEGLPAVLTITLALGVQRMARHSAIVRRLPAVEALGSVTTICTDKTGTLTRNEMTVQRVITSTQVFGVSGSGYAPHGGFAIGDKETDLSGYTHVLDLMRTGLLCNDAQLHEDAGQWHITGDPTEGALIPLALKAGLDARFEHGALPRTDHIPFESEHRFMATLHHDHNGHAFIFVKGAVEQVLAMCHRQRGGGDDEPLDLPYWHTQMAATGAVGQRVLALAMKAVDEGQRVLNFADMQGGFTLLGMVGISDPPRDEAIAAVRECRTAGIRVKMITGDHADTARAIAAQIGIGNGRVLTGSKLDDLDDEALRKAVNEVDVFARASPEHKLRLVTALQANGEIVAMTGDGVNDAPALKRADIGVAMGMKGTEVAKEAAEMVLADDNFATIAHAVREGRTVYDNIKKAIVFIMPTNGGEAGIVLVAILFGMALPLTPVQILWVNMVTAVTLALALSFEKAEPEVMRRAPRAADESILSGFMIWRISFVSALLALGTIALFLWELARGASLEAARTLAINALVMGEIAYLFNCRYLLAPVRSWQDLVGNRYVLLSITVLLVAQLAFTYLPFMQKLFGVVAIDAIAWASIAGFGVLLFCVVEIEKMWLKRQSR
ncbi:cation-transporting P-type ATPase [Sideroxydans lithotrophicus]|uniref:ATPase, P-type (Transporting), HAD superfamily, subfamily IC n=1 Tax=Sideroxydans lithotrophicus (strain ES-1) TaxID=580332 RepID=D5CPU4_SIDLE|nr:cation-transporting P-type ATPase [Sideroxydans lithotrophicus]ADE13089.1 ATPase, P-type (transporting), HAD superfamily, subfamily IC [Sideroxydans lithotrophicus ES-1]